MICPNCGEETFLLWFTFCYKKHKWTLEGMMEEHDRLLAAQDGPDLVDVCVCCWEILS